MNLAIIFALGVLAGAVFTGIVFRLFLVGTLLVDHSDPDGPFYFWNYRNGLKLWFRRSMSC